MKNAKRSTRKNFKRKIRYRIIDRIAEILDVKTNTAHTWKTYNVPTEMKEKWNSAIEQTISEIYNEASDEIDEIEEEVSEARKRLNGYKYFL